MLFFSFHAENCYYLKEQKKSMGPAFKIMLHISANSSLLYKETYNIYFYRKVIIILTTTPDCYMQSGFVYKLFDVTINNYFGCLL